MNKILRLLLTQSWTCEVLPGLIDFELLGVQVSEGKSIAGSGISS